MNELLSTTYKAGFTFNQLRVDERIIQVSAPLLSTDRTSLGGSHFSKKNKALQDLVRKADTAYTFDGIVRNIVDQYTENFKDFSFRSENEAARKYLEKRLNLIGLRMGEGWKTLISRCILEYFKVGTGCLIKIRGDEPNAKRALYTDKPYPVVSFQLISASRIEPKLTKEGQVVGWRLWDAQNSATTRLKKMTIVRGSTALSKNQTKVQRQAVPEASENLLVENVDLTLIRHDHGADTYFGQGLTFSGIEDINLLRTIESNTSIMIKKYSMPLLHHKIKRMTGPTGGFQSEIDRNVQLHQNGAPDGVIVTGDNHEIQAVGAESQALRVEGYLDYFSSRACVGLGGSAELLGLRGTGSAAAYEAATQRLMRRVHFCQEVIARQLSEQIFWELLYEGGFDPYENENDRVFIEFVSIDEEGDMKRQTHAADLHTKGYLDHDQALQMGLGDIRGSLRRKPQESKMHVNRVQIPVKKAAPPHPPVAGAKKKAKPKTRKEFEEQLQGYWPESREDIPDFLFVVHRLYSLELTTTERWEEPLSLLCEDRQAMVDFMYQQVLGL